MNQFLTEVTVHPNGGQMVDWLSRSDLWGQIWALSQTRYFENDVSISRVYSPATPLRAHSPLFQRHHSRYLLETVKEYNCNIKIFDINIFLEVMLKENPSVMISDDLRVLIRKLWVVILGSDGNLLRCHLRHSFIIHFSWKNELICFYLALGTCCVFETEQCQIMKLQNEYTALHLYIFHILQAHTYNTKTFSIDYAPLQFSDRCGTFNDLQLLWFTNWLIYGINGY